LRHLHPFPTRRSSDLSGVNYTAGLPFVRTSPDHGTGYDIAGKNLASETSFREALFTAVHIVQRRREQEVLLENPLVTRRLSRDQLGRASCREREWNWH